MNRYTFSTSHPIHLDWPVLVAQLAWMVNAVIDTAMAGGCLPSARYALSKFKTC